MKLIFGSYRRQVRSPVHRMMGNRKRGCEIIQPTKRNEEAPGPVKDWGLNHGIIDV